MTSPDEDHENEISRFVLSLTKKRYCTCEDESEKTFRVTVTHAYGKSYYSSVFEETGSKEIHMYCVDRSWMRSDGLQMIMALHVD